MRRSVICLFINLFVCAIAYSQDTLPAFKPLQKQIPFTKTPQNVSLLPLPVLYNNPALIPLSYSIKTLPAGFYYNSIGFFCQKELQLEKAVKLPIKLRLGSVNYTDKMEGKGH